MPTAVISSVEQVTPEWLTDALLASGALERWQSHRRRR